jgi:thiol-disulfide isomerase/thioredoxin
VEFPHIERIHQEYADQPFVVLAVESKEDRTGAKELIEENNYSFKVLFDTERVHSNDYQVYGFPTTFILDKGGNIVFKHIGFFPGMEVTMENEIRSLLDLSPKLEPTA